MTTCSRCVEDRAPELETRQPHAKRRRLLLVRHGFFATQMGNVARQTGDCAGTPQGGSADDGLLNRPRSTLAAAAAAAAAEASRGCSTEQAESGWQIQLINLRRYFLPLEARAPLHALPRYRAPFCNPIHV